MVSSFGASIRFDDDSSHPSYEGGMELGNIHYKISRNRVSIFSSLVGIQ
jgi:hypothetical protein